MNLYIAQHNHIHHFIKDLAKKDKRVRYISFSRNFGKESAMYAGLENSKGDYVAMLPIILLNLMWKDNSVE